jgi:hypothetical protein
MSDRSSPIKPIIKAIKDIQQPKLHTPAGMGRRSRPKKLTRSPVRKLGPRIFRRGVKATLGNDWCTPWPGFIGATNSLSEQMIYAALAIFFHDRERFWLPPYDGGINWKYQTKIGGGRLFKGGQVCDFEVTYNNEQMCLRVQSLKWHIMVDAAKKMLDLFLKAGTKDLIIRDIFEQDFVWDCTLKAAVRVVAATLAGKESANPGSLGTARQTRRLW